MYTPKLPKKLNKAEKKLVKACKQGKDCELGDGKLPPEKGSKGRRIRAEVIRFLAMGGDEKHPMDPRGVRLVGAWIAGTVDLENATVPVDLGLVNSRFEKPLVLCGARTRSVSLHGSLATGIKGDGVRLDGSLFLRGGFKSLGEVRFLGVEVGGIFVCRGGDFDGAGGHALNCSGMTVKGSIFLDEGFSSKGEVKLLGAKIGGNFECIGGAFNGADGNALVCDGIVVKGAVILSEGFSSKGDVRFPGTEVGGDFVCRGGDFDGADGDALQLQNVAIEGGLLVDGETRFKGRVDLTSALVRNLVDDEACWPEKGKLFLDGFRYERYSGYAPTDAQTRLKWLDLQPKSHLTTDFRPQPFEQLAKVLREMGHVRDAREILVAKNEAMRKSGLLSKPVQWWYSVLNATIGYGFKPWKVFYWVAPIIVMGMLLFGWANISSSMVPAKERMLLSKKWTTCIQAYPAEPLAPCFTRKVPDYPRYHWALYSIDVFLPIVNLHQEEYWAPAPVNTAGYIARIYLWLEILAGWLLTSLGVAGLTGLVKKE